ncbi:hypothetical protein FACS1894160_3160 [Bacteroidia bacterium]|nr:hypothetical protein FACS1894123_05390 [Bacteroidia bacterium]GHV08600.1 hypothetical protein FACS1894160_3160 [Bacteroidia bacterium]
MQHPFQKLADTILLNAYSVNSIGLYDGKCGMSLCLFELAHYLRDEQIEEYACELLRESLALSSKCENISLEYGLAGIGFAFLYLVENKFIDADIKDLFGNQLQKIQSQIKEIDNFSEKHLSLVHFLMLYNSLYKDSEMHNWVDKIIEDTEKILIQSFSDFNVIKSDIIKIKALDIFENYLKEIFLYDYPVSIPLLKLYSQLFEKNKIGSRFGIGYYLDKLARKLNNSELLVIAQANKKFALQNIHPDTLNLAQRVNLLYLLNQEENITYAKQVSFLEENVFDFSNSECEKKISQSIQHNHCVVLLCWVCFLVLQILITEKKP